MNVARVGEGATEPGGLRGKAAAGRRCSDFIALTCHAVSAPSQLWRLAQIQRCKQSWDGVVKCRTVWYGCMLVKSLNDKH